VSTTPRGNDRGWLVSPRFDLLFLANLAWPVLLVPGLVADDRAGPVPFAQLYFLTTPHRWITLFLVAADPERRGGRTWLFAGILALVAAAIVTLQLSSDALICLVMVDFAWNAWHFGAQHAGIARIYARKAGLAYSGFEKNALRVFVPYVLLRVPEWTTSGLSSSVVRGADLAMLCVPVVLVVRSLTRDRLSATGKQAYVMSVCVLYACMLAARSFGWYAIQAPLFLAAAVFHATEYLAIVSIYARGRAARGPSGAFQSMARTWGLVLGTFVLVVGSADVILSRIAFEMAAALNLGAAFLHYAYDGLIWKLRQPATARSFGAPETTTAGGPVA
jgi:hypothetical protein